MDKDTGIRRVSGRGLVTEIHVYSRKSYTGGGGFSADYHDWLGNSLIMPT